MKNGTSNFRLRTSQDGSRALRTALRDVLEHLVDDRAALPSNEVYLKESGAYVYLEFELPDAADVAIDLCVHQGRAYVRVKR